MRILWLIILGLCSTTLWAEEKNPYLGVPATELRTRIAAFDAQVREQSWYQVEVIAFARRQPVSGEYWRLDQQPRLSASGVIQPGSGSVLLPEQADEADRKAVAQGAWKWLPADQLMLNDMIKPMERDGDYRILLHGGWRQPMRERGRAFPIMITGGKALPPTSPSPVADQGPDPLPAATPVPPLNPTLQFNSVDGAEQYNLMPFSEPEFQATLRLHLARYLHVEPDAWLARTSDAGQRYWVQINQKRRMRGEELHYLDHPLFGLLLRMTPWKTPEQQQLEKLEQALKASQKSR